MPTDKELLFNDLIYPPINAVESDNVNLRVFCSATGKDDRKTAEECYNYIKKKLGVYLHRGHAPQVPISMLELYIEGAI